MNTLSLFRSIATLGPVGYFPFAPGTWGTAAGMGFILVTTPSKGMLFFFIVIFFILGTITSHFAEIHLNKRDPNKIVIDEFTGYLISMGFLEITSFTLLSSFFFFRIFDILKPPPIRSFELFFKGGLGVMMDDVMAGIYANIAVQTCIFLIKVFS